MPLPTKKRKRNAKKPKAAAYKDPFYISKEWRAVRYQALENSSGRCECCGASPAHGIKLHVDHIRPKSIHPSLALSLSNLQVLCEDCNMGKSNRYTTDWKSMRRQEQEEAKDAFLSSLDRFMAQ